MEKTRQPSWFDMLPFEIILHIARYCDAESLAMLDEFLPESLKIFTGDSVTNAGLRLPLRHYLKQWDPSLFTGVLLEQTCTDFPGEEDKWYPGIESLILHDFATDIKYGKTCYYFNSRACHNLKELTLLRFTPQFDFKIAPSLRLLQLDASTSCVYTSAPNSVPESVHMPYVFHTWRSARDSLPRVTHLVISRIPFDDAQNRTAIDLRGMLKLNTLEIRDYEIARKKVPILMPAQDVDIVLNDYTSSLYTDADGLLANSPSIKRAFQRVNHACEILPLITHATMRVDNMWWTPSNESLDFSKFLSLRFIYLDITCYVGALQNFLKFSPNMEVIETADPTKIFHTVHFQNHTFVTLGSRYGDAPKVGGVRCISLNVASSIPTFFFDAGPEPHKKLENSQYYGFDESKITTLVAKSEKESFENGYQDPNQKEWMITSGFTAISAHDYEGSPRIPMISYTLRVLTFFVDERFAIRVVNDQFSCKLPKLRALGLHFSKALRCRGKQYVSNVLLRILEKLPQVKILAFNMTMNDLRWMGRDVLDSYKEIRNVETIFVKRYTEGRRGDCDDNRKLVFKSWRMMYIARGLDPCAEMLNSIRDKTDGPRVSCVPNDVYLPPK